MKKNMLTIALYSVMTVAGLGLSGCAYFGYHKSCCSSQECGMNKDKSACCKKDQEGAQMKKTETSAVAPATSEAPAAQADSATSTAPTVTLAPASAAPATPEAQAAQAAPREPAEAKPAAEVQK